MPEKPEWDLGHQESLLYLEFMWATRGHLIDQMKTDGNEKVFWDFLRKQAPFVQGPLFVSDSHCMAYSLLKRILKPRGVSRVVLFDAHHDCWKGEKGQVMCHNWLREWLRGSAKREAVWVVPEWRDREDCVIPDDMQSRVEVVGFRKGLELGLKAPVAVHTCRSGCWVPPWLDGSFKGFLEGFEGCLEGVVGLQHGQWDPLRVRWTEKEMEAAREMDRQVKSTMKVGSIRASEWVDCKTEVAIK